MGFPIVTESIHNFTSYVEVAIALNLFITVASNFKRPSRLISWILGATDKAITDLSKISKWHVVSLNDESSSSSNGSMYTEWKRKKINSRMDTIQLKAKWIDRYLVKILFTQIVPVLLTVILLFSLIFDNSKFEIWFINFVLWSPFYSVFLIIFSQLIFYLYYLIVSFTDRKHINEVIEHNDEMMDDISSRFRE